MKAMLPIKTKAGLKERNIEVSDHEEEGEEEEEEEEEEVAPKKAKGADDDDMDEDEEEENKVKEPEIAPGEEVSVVELYARRKELLLEKKIHIGSLASSFLEAPEDRLPNLQKLVKLVSAQQPESVIISVQRLAAASVLEVLKDVTPGYKISHHNTEEKLKKETLKLQKYEAELLRCYKLYLLKLEKPLNLFKKRGKTKPALEVKQAEFFLSCMCQLLVVHPHFNFAKNILHAITPILTSGHPGARNMVKKTLEEVFKGDMRGEISLEAARLINHLVKSRKHKVRTEVVDVLRALR